MLSERTVLLVGIVNHEYRPVNYTMEVRLENRSLPENLEQISLAHNETWEEPVTFTPSFEGKNMELEFLFLTKQIEVYPTGIYISGSM